jgi:hypothetical protein
VGRIIAGDGVFQNTSLIAAAPSRTIDRNVI